MEVKARPKVAFLRFLIFVVCGITTLNGQEPKPDVLDGCASVAELAGNLRHLVEMNWRSFTALNLQKEWSVPVEPVKCDDSNSCSLMVLTAE